MIPAVIKRCSSDAAKGAALSSSCHWHKPSQNSWKVVWLHRAFMAHASCSESDVHCGLALLRHNSHGVGGSWYCGAGGVSSWYKACQRSTVLKSCQSKCTDG